MSPVRYIDHHGKQILVMDFTTSSSTAEVTQTSEEAKKIVALRKPQSLLALVDFTGMKIDRERIRIIQGMAAHNRPYVRFIALVGLGFFRSIAFRVMLRMMGSLNHRVFGKRERGLEWLVRKV